MRRVLSITRSMLYLFSVLASSPAQASWQHFSLMVSNLTTLQARPGTRRLWWQLPSLPIEYLGCRLQVGLRESLRPQVETNISFLKVLYPRSPRGPIIALGPEVNLWGLGEQLFWKPQGSQLPPSHSLVRFWAMSHPLRHLMVLYRGELMRAVPSNSSPWSAISWLQGLQFPLTLPAYRFRVVPEIQLGPWDHRWLKESRWMLYILAIRWPLFAGHFFHGGFSFKWFDDQRSAPEASWAPWMRVHFNFTFSQRPATSGTLEAPPPPLLRYFQSQGHQPYAAFRLPPNAIEGIQGMQMVGEGGRPIGPLLNFPSHLGERYTSEAFDVTPEAESWQEIPGGPQTLFKSQ